MDKAVILILTVLALAALGFLIYCYVTDDSSCNRPMGYTVEEALMASAPEGNEQYSTAQPVTESFYGGADNAGSADASTVGVQASEDDMGQNEQPRSVGDNNNISSGISQLPSEC